MSDSINHPPHYIEGRTIEPIAVIEDWKLGYHLGCALKYLSRAGRKGDEIQDLHKAIWYLKRRIQLVSSQQDPTQENTECVP